MAQKLLKYGIGIFSKVGTYPTVLGVDGEKAKVNTAGDVIVVQKDEEWKRGFETWCEYQPDGSRIQMGRMPHTDEAARERYRRAWRDSFPGWEGETCRDFVHIKIPDGHASPVPVWLELGTASQVIIVVGKDSKVTIEEDRLVTGPTAAFVSLWIGERAEVTYIAKRLVAGEADEHLVRDAWIEAGGRLRLREASFEGGLFRAQTRISLAGEEASVDVRSLFLGDKERFFDFYHEVKHFHPKTRSVLRTFGVLKDRSHAIARSLVRIEKEGAGSKASQKFEALLLSDTAAVDPVPMLEIENPDVSCSHAASVSRPDEEKLFYLMSRGLDRETAMRMYIQGFLESGVANEFDYRSYDIAVAIEKKLS